MLISCDLVLPEFTLTCPVCSKQCVALVAYMSSDLSSMAMERYKCRELRDMHFVYGAVANNSQRVQRMYNEQYPEQDVLITKRSLQSTIDWKTPAQPSEIFCSEYLGQYCGQLLNWTLRFATSPHLANVHLPTLLEDVPLRIRETIWYQHDGVPAHFVDPVHAVITNTYVYWWIGWGGPARSPDLTPFYFFLLEYMKAVMYWTSFDSDMELAVDSWVIVHNLQSHDGGILDPDDRLNAVVDDREQIVASYEDGEGMHHGGGDGASGSSVGTSSPDLFQLAGDDQVFLSPAFLHLPLVIRPREKRHKNA
ncbi:hypothetical protein PR048_031954 [Dryococelus australis]|uniref:Par3/HAL N-terminal domain-containing protein n=1 Tax=Dryococelus australis TaxID=614101 RepID=A0ABQ9G6R1_9NEOP|nr:hypothetical protein PR048_031954 [Dryococelus australis]